MIKTVIFDLGKVIIPFDLNRGYRALQQHCGYPAEEIPNRLRTTDLVRRFESGQVEPNEFVVELSKLLGIEVEYPRFCELWSAIFLPGTIVPEPMLEGLKRRHRLLLLSNTNAIHWAMVRQHYPAMRHFDDYVLSYEVKAMKPAPLIYEEAVRRARCRPQECFFTDDIPAYVEAARNLGIDAVEFTGLEQLERDLRERGIEW